MEANHGGSSGGLQAGHTSAHRQTLFKYPPWGTHHPSIQWQPLGQYTHWSECWCCKPLSRILWCPYHTPTYTYISWKTNITRHTYPILSYPMPILQSVEHRELFCEWLCAFYSMIWYGFCTQLAKTFTAETSCNQLLLIDWFCYVLHMLIQTRMLSKAKEVLYLFNTSILFYDDVSVPSYSMCNLQTAGQVIKSCMHVRMCSIPLSVTRLPSP